MESWNGDNGAVAQALRRAFDWDELLATGARRLAAAERARLGDPRDDRVAARERGPAVRGRLGTSRVLLESRDPRAPRGATRWALKRLSSAWNVAARPNSPLALFGLLRGHVSVLAASRRAVAGRRRHRCSQSSAAGLSSCQRRAVRSETQGRICQDCQPAAAVLDDPLANGGVAAPADEPTQILGTAAREHVEQQQKGRPVGITGRPP